MSEAYLAPPGARCERPGCVIDTRRLILLKVGDVELGFVCERCEEDFMVAMAEGYRRRGQSVEGQIGLKKWRDAKAQRVWPEGIE